MKSYKIFLIVFIVLFISYAVLEITKPQPTDWAPSFSAAKKIPFGSYILYHQLNNIFPEAKIETYREPVYNQLHKKYFENTAAIIIDDRFNPTKLDIEEMLIYAEEGNYVFISSAEFSKPLLDSLGLISSEDFFTQEDSVYNFRNQSLKNEEGYILDKLNKSASFKIKSNDSVIVLATNKENHPNFVKVKIGDGAFFLHTNPVCFTNYFMLQKNNSEYTSKALSYIPDSITNVMWDEYTKFGREGAATPLRFFLSNSELRWALWLTITGSLIFIFFEMKRKQRIIPVINPLRNTTLDFVKTVSSVYFNQKYNTGIANKKIIHWLEFVRQRFFISTQILNSEFVDALSKKSGINKKDIEKIIDYYAFIQNSSVSDAVLIQINEAVDDFYKQAK